MAEDFVFKIPLLDALSQRTRADRRAHLEKEGISMGSIVFQGFSKVPYKVVGILEGKVLANIRPANKPNARIIAAVEPRSLHT
ncbi:MAG: hypothetical protein V4437_03265 [Patescibacteria group bacterium]